MQQRHFKLLKLKDSVVIFIFDYAILVKNMHKKSKIKASFVVSFSTVIMKLGLQTT